MRIYFHHTILCCAIVCLSYAGLCAEEKEQGTGGATGGGAGEAAGEGELRAEGEAEGEAEEVWIQLFDGENIHGWTPKFVGYDLGVNFRNTFVVRDGFLTICYDNYKQGFGDNIGYLFYKDEFSHYVLRVEYRFLGARSSTLVESSVQTCGLMLHGQSAETMNKGQRRPVSVAARLLDEYTGLHGAQGEGRADNLSLNTKADASQLEGKQQEADQWITSIVEVHGGRVIRHKSGGLLIAEYKKPSRRDGSLLDSGTISLQANSCPIQFRKIELKVLDH